MRSEKLLLLEVSNLLKALSGLYFALDLLTLKRVGMAILEQTDIATHSRSMSI